MSLRCVLALPVAAVLAGAIEPPAGAQTPFSFDTAFGRLPKDVVPVDYSVSIAPDLAARTLSGQETVSLEFRQPSERIVFNSLNASLEAVQLDGEAVKSVASDDAKQLTTVTLPKPASSGRHTLTFSYRARIEDRPLGLFVEPYLKSDGTRALLLVTQLEAADARRMFPCWDEPAFRSTFELTVTVPSEWTAVSNMPVATRTEQGKLATIRFQRTPKMPSYLLELSAGDLAEISAEHAGVRLGIVTVRGRERDGFYALANTQQILSDYNDYFGYSYPLPKLDSIAVPGGFPGAMENWGAITYNDRILLVSASSTVADRQEVFSTQAHEIAHQWNGDLVTMGWWDDIWLNESFASWMAAKETDWRNPSWHWWEAQDADKEAAMSADARVNSHAIQQHVRDEVEATSAFDPRITYNKGQAFLRMLEAYLGPDVFRDGIRRFMKEHAFSNATTADLWNSLSVASGRSVGDLASDWTAQPGFPLVSVATSCDAEGRRTLTLSQRRFLLHGTDPTPRHWNVPLQIRSGAEGAPRPVLLTQDGQSAPAGRCEEPLSINAGAVGYFRAAYDAATLQTDAKSFGALTSGDRVALLDDQWALVEAGLQELPSYLALASAMGSEPDERAWTQIMDALGTIEYAARGTDGHDAFATYARSIIKPLAVRLGWQEGANEAPGTKKLRRRVLTDLGIWGGADTIAEARKRFAAFLADRDSMRPDDQDAVLWVVARYADLATFEQLHTIAKSARDDAELRRFYFALMQVRDPQLAARAAAIALSPEIPKHIETLRLELVDALNDANPALAWSTFTEHYDALVGPLDSYGSVFLAQRTPESYWNAVAPDKLEAWLKSHLPSELWPDVERGAEAARFKLSEKTALVQAADRFIASQQSQRGS